MQECEGNRGVTFNKSPHRSRISFLLEEVLDTPSQPLALVTGDSTMFGLRGTKLGLIEEIYPRDDVLDPCIRLGRNPGLGITMGGSEH